MFSPLTFLPGTHFRLSNCVNDLQFDSDNGLTIGNLFIKQMHQLFNLQCHPMNIHQLQSQTWIHILV